MLLDADTAILLPFNELAEIHPTDAAGGLVDLLTAAGLTRPTVQMGNGRIARIFGADRGFEAAEAVVGQGLLRRSLTIDAAIDWTNGRGNASYQTLIGRGSNDGTAAQRNLYVFQAAGSAGGQTGTLRLLWQVSGGSLASVTSSSFAIPADASRMYVACVRRWISATSIEVSFYVNGVLVSTGTSIFGDIVEGESGTTYVGVWRSGGSYQNHWLGSIDWLRVSKTERSAEEIRQVYLRHFVLPQEAYETLRAYLPSGGVFGEVYSRDPDSIIQRELRVEADALATTLGKARELEDDFLPDRAWSMLARWERVCKIPGLPTDSLAVRRERVVAHLRKVFGFQVSEVKKAVAGPLQLPESQIEIVQFTNFAKDLFDGASIAPNWWQEPNQGTIGISGGKVDLDAQVGDDARWNETVALPVRMRTAVPDDRSMEIYLAMTPNLAADGGCGAFVMDRSGGAHLFGLKRTAGVTRWWHRTIIPGGATSNTVGSVLGAGTVHWLRYRMRPDWSNCDIYRATDPVGLPWEANGQHFPWIAEFTSAPTIGAPNSQVWAGVFVFGDAASLASAIGVDVLSWALYCPYSEDVFRWYVYRDPVMPPTNYDESGAQVVIDRIAPAHTIGTVIRAKTVLCDSPFSRCDREPLGA